MAHKFNYSLLIIGGGSAGTTAAVNAVSLKTTNKVAIIERGLLGGTCTNVGCVPSKSYLHDSELIRKTNEARKYALFNDTSIPNFNPVRERKNRIVKAMRESGTFAIEQSGIKIIKGAARIKDANSVLVDGKIIRAENILICSGAKPFIPPIEGISKTPFLSSTSSLALEKLPKSILIIGGAYIGLEFASFFKSFNVKTTVIEAANRIAPNEDADISQALTEYLTEQGINIAVNTKVLKAEGNNKQVKLKALQNGKKLNFTGEKMLVATGRVPNLDDLGLDDAGIKYSRRGIEVNRFLETNIPSIYAAGDVIPSLQLEHVAVYEGWLAAKNMYGAKKATDYRVIPRVMFSYPQVASIGETEEQAANHTKIVTASYPYAGIARAQIDRQKQGIIKLIADVSQKKLLGAHIVGDEAGNLIHIASSIMKADVNIKKLANSVSAYPTLSQGFFYAIDQINDKLA